MKIYALLLLLTTSNSFSNAWVLPSARNHPISSLSSSTSVEPDQDGNENPSDGLLSRRNLLGVATLITGGLLTAAGTSQLLNPSGISNTPLVRPVRTRYITTLDFVRLVQYEHAVIQQVQFSILQRGTMHILLKDGTHLRLDLNPEDLAPMAHFCDNYNVPNDYAESQEELVQMKQLEQNELDQSDMAGGAWVVTM